MLCVCGGGVGGGGHKGNTWYISVGSPQWSPPSGCQQRPLFSRFVRPTGKKGKRGGEKKKKTKNVLVDVTRRGGGGGWAAGRSDEDRCLLTPFTPTESVFHRGLAEVAV